MSLTHQADHAIAPRLTAAVLGMIGSFILFTAYLAIPPVGLFSGIFASLPACHVRLLHGRTASIMLILGVTATVSALFGILAGCLYLGMCGIIGALMPELLARGFSGSRAIFWTTLVNLAVIAAGIAAHSMITGLDVRQFVSSEIASSLNQALAMYEKSGVKGEDMDIIRRSMKMVADILNRLYPALVAVMLIAMAGCNIALVKKTTASKVNLNIGEFSSYKNPDMLVWLLIVSGFALLLTSPMVITPALNVLLLVSLLYFLQGMAVVGSMISKQPLAALLKGGLYVMLVFQPYLAAVVAGIGLFDLWVDFRAPKKQENL